MNRYVHYDNDSNEADIPIPKDVSHLNIRNEGHEQNQRVNATTYHGFVEHFHPKSALCLVRLHLAIHHRVEKLHEHENLGLVDRLVWNKCWNQYKDNPSQIRSKHVQDCKLAFCEGEAAVNVIVSCSERFAFKPKFVIKHEEKEENRYHEEEQAKGHCQPLVVRVLVRRVNHFNLDLHCNRHADRIVRNIKHSNQSIPEVLFETNKKGL